MQKIKAILGDDILKWEGPRKRIDISGILVPNYGEFLKNLSSDRIEAKKWLL